VVGDEESASTCFSIGADAWLPRAVGLNVIAAQVLAALKAPRPPRPEPTLGAGRLRMDVAARRVDVDGRELALKPREFDLLKVLLENRGMALSRARILAGAWGTRFVGEPKTVDVHVAWLRPKLEGSGLRVTTLRGVGYRLDALEPAGQAPVMAIVSTISATDSHSSIVASRRS
jgi:two-component system alkaline phosphatase synthesis response regulator PhoP